ncbi:MAG: glycine--tRNA ligase subunit beta [Candidatus Eisenbacteria bacterium]
MSAPREDFLLELGVEELPTTYIAPALSQLERQLKEALGEARLRFDSSITFATPRRLAVLVSELETRQDDYTEEATGPPASAAWDKDGQPTKALLGFARGKGVDVSAVRRVQTDKGEYVAVTVERKGKVAAEILAAAIARIVPTLSFPKTMRWLDADVAGGAEFRFARPLRWVVALLGGQVLDLRLAGLPAGRVSRGHRFLHPGEVAIGQPTDYVGALARAGVIADPRLRQESIVEQATKLAAGAGGRVVADEELVDINNFLVETPTALLGRFDASYLDLPREVIVMALREHQRYFAVEDAAGNLLPAFVGVRNGDDRNLEGVIAGNTAVLKARLDDARFYWDTDVARSPEARVPDLAGIVWLEGMGSVLDKTRRVQGLAAWVAGRVGADAAVVERAALLAKTDLLSEMIGSGKEYASLEGVIGAYYAGRHGETPAVVAAIREHVLPRGAGDALPASDAGAALSIADRADTVVGAFVAGKIPSGSEDPYGVRRAGNNVVRVLLEQQRALSLDALTDAAIAGYVAAGREAPSPELRAKLAEFWNGRIAHALGERGAAYDEIAAALGGHDGKDDPTEVERRARALARWRGNADFLPLVVGYKRVANLLRAASDAPEGVAGDLSDPHEAALSQALARASREAEPLFAARDYDQVLAVLLSLRAPIDAFFESVMVNVEDAAVRRRRLGLLATARALFDRGWDLSKVVVEG